MGIRSASEVARSVSTIICREIDDPARWPFACRVFVEKVGRVDVTRVKFSQALFDTCYSIVEEAAKHSISAEAIIEAAHQAVKELEQEE